MSRYIDADALKKRVSELIIPDWTRTLIRSWLDSAPTIDAVPVVRCRECIYAERARVNDKGFTICEASYMDITDNDFCSYGERKEKTDE